MAGYSGTPLARKLGIKETFHILPVAAPDGYRRLLGPLPPLVRFVTRLDRTTNLVHLFTSKKSDLTTALSEYRKKLDPTATVWVSWPKKSSKKLTDITEDVVRAVALPLGFVDVKVCAVDETWSALKLVIRKELRQQKCRESRLFEDSE